MNSLVFVESGEGKIRKLSLEAVAYAHAMGGTVAPYLPRDSNSVFSIEPMAIAVTVPPIACA